MGEIEIDEASLSPELSRGRTSSVSVASLESVGPDMGQENQILS